MKFAFIFGTRPEIIKLSPLIRLFKERQNDYLLIHSNQHYSVEMDKIFFEELDLPTPSYNLHVTGESSQGAMVARILAEVEKVLIKEHPDWVIVQGDTNTVLAGALAASKLGIKIAHVEAGLRSYDRTMPEEINRVITDHLSEALFCPTEKQKNILLNEGISSQKLYVTGNTIVDAVEQNLLLAEKSPLQGKYKGQKYILLTMHRPSNVDSKESLANIIQALGKLSDKLNTKFIFPIHPRTKASLAKHNLSLDANKFSVIEPTGYLEMLLLEKYAELIVTDSGGVQEEACIMHVPCITIRENTERPETVEVGSSILVGSSSERMLDGAQKIMNSDRSWPNPFGDGKASKRIENLLSLC